MKMKEGKSLFFLRNTLSTLTNHLFNNIHTFYYINVNINYFHLKKKLINSFIKKLKKQN